MRLHVNRLNSDSFVKSIESTIANSLSHQPKSEDPLRLSLIYKAKTTNSVYCLFTRGTTFTIMRISDHPDNTRRMFDTIYFNEDRKNNQPFYARLNAYLYKLVQQKTLSTTVTYGMYRDLVTLDMMNKLNYHLYETWEYGTSPSNNQIWFSPRPEKYQYDLRDVDDPPKLSELTKIGSVTTFHALLVSGVVETRSMRTASQEWQGTSLMQVIVPLTVDKLVKLNDKLYKDTFVQDVKAKIVSLPENVIGKAWLNPETSTYVWNPKDKVPEDKEIENMEPVGHEAGSKEMNSQWSKYNDYYLLERFDHKFFKITSEQAQQIAELAGVNYQGGVLITTQEAVDNAEINDLGQIKLNKLPTMFSYRMVDDWTTEDEIMGQLKNIQGLDSLESVPWYNRDYDFESPESAMKVLNYTQFATTHIPVSDTSFFHLMLR